MRDPGPLESRTYPIEEDMPGQLVTWRVQRLGWLGFGLICIAALLGVFGDGPLARASLADPTGRLRLDYQRIERRDAPALIRIGLSGLPPGGEAVLRYGRDFIDRRSLRAVDPPPLRAAGDAAALLHTYAVPASGALEVLIEYRPRSIGAGSSAIGLVGGPEVSVHQIILP